MTFTRRNLIASTIALTAFPGTAARAGSRVLKVGTSNTFGFAATFAAHGDDRDGDLRFEIIPFAGGSPQIISALNAGELDIGELGEVGPVIAQSAGVDFKIIAATEPWGAGQALIVDPKSGIHSLADIKGKKISYTRGTNSHWVLLKALEKAGLQSSDVEHVFLPAGANIQAVLASGGIDAAVSIDTLLTAFEKAGCRRIVGGAEVGAENPLYYIASDAAIKSRSTDVAAFVTRLASHVAWSHGKPEERAAAVAALLRIDADVALIAERKRPARLRQIGRELIANNQRIADVFLQQGLIPTRLDAALSFTDAFNPFIAS